MSSDSILDLFKEIFNFGNMKKLHKAKSGEYIGYSNTGICLLAKKCFTQSGCV